MKKFAALFLAICLSAVFSIPTFAATPRFTYATRATTTLSITSGGMATCIAKVSSTGKVTGADISMELQVKDGSSWSTVDSWSQYVSGSNPALQKSVSVSSGTYRVVADFSIDGNDGGSETASATSSTAKN